MFASLSSLFPSALQQAPLGARPPDVLSPPPPTPPADDDPVPDPPRRKEKKEKATEAFIIVRPPPSKSAQPLSLQVQLVPPQSRYDRPVQALDTSSPDDLNTDLKRTHSNGSEGSSYSGYTSATSVSSFASSSSASSCRRTIIPLYNLNVHAVMPTTILDAGTDAKVAKFAKRGLEVIGLAFLEPIEVRPCATPNSTLVPSVSARNSVDDSLREFGTTSPGPSTRRPVSPARPGPDTSRPAASAPGDLPHSPTLNLPLAPPLPPPDMQPSQRSAKKLFTRMFKKKDTPPQLSVTVPVPGETSAPQQSPFRNYARLSDDVPASQPDTPLHHDARPCTPLISNTTSQSAVLGVHPTLYPPVNNPKGRPVKYVWVVRKWLKGSDTSILNGMMGKLSVAGRETSVPDVPHVDVRFEWCREQKREGGRKARRDKRPSSRDKNHSPARRRLPSNMSPQPVLETLSPVSNDHRSSFISHNSCGSDSGGSSDTSPNRRAEDSGEESDPEDSETPWTCTVTAQYLGHSPQASLNAAREPIRLKVATLAPTPHHPKVVALLKMPFPLPDIEVHRLLVRRRLVTSLGISKTTLPDAGGFVLTAEEIKDTISSTALWLVVREAFGGVGRERKKGKP